MADATASPHPDSVQDRLLRMITLLTPKSDTFDPLVSKIPLTRGICPLSDVRDDDTFMISLGFQGLGTEAFSLEQFLKYHYTMADVPFPLEELALERVIPKLLRDQSYITRDGNTAQIIGSVQRGSTDPLRFIALMGRPPLSPYGNHAYIVYLENGKPDDRQDTDNAEDIIVYRRTSHHLLPFL